MPSRLATRSVLWAWSGPHGAKNTDIGQGDAGFDLPPMQGPSGGLSLLITVPSKAIAMSTSNAIRVPSSLRVPLDEVLSATQSANGPSVRAQVGALLAAVDQCGLNLDFDWPRWVFTPEGARLLRGESLEDATVMDLRRVLSVHIAVERIATGHLASEVRTGRIRRIFVRLRDLCDEPAAGAVELRDGDESESGVHSWPRER